MASSMLLYDVNWPDLPITSQPGFRYFDQVIGAAKPYLTSAETTVTVWYKLVPPMQRDYYTFRELNDENLSPEQFADQLERDRKMVGFGCYFNVEKNINSQNTSIGISSQHDTACSQKTDVELAQEQYTASTTSAIGCVTTTVSSSSGGRLRYIPNIPKEMCEHKQRKYFVKGPFPERFGINIWKTEEARRRALYDPENSRLLGPKPDEPWFTFRYGYKAQNRETNSAMDAFFNRRQLLLFEEETTARLEMVPVSAQAAQYDLSNESNLNQSDAISNQNPCTEETEANQPSVATGTTAGVATAAPATAGVEKEYKLKGRLSDLYFRCNDTLPNVTGSEFKTSLNILSRKGELKEEKRNEELNELLVREIRHLRVLEAIANPPEMREGVSDPKYN